MSRRPPWRLVFSLGRHSLKKMNRQRGVCRRSLKNASPSGWLRRKRQPSHSVNHAQTDNRDAFVGTVSKTRRKRLLEPSEDHDQPSLATAAKVSICSGYSCFCHRRQRPSRLRPSKSTCSTLKKPRGDSSRSHAPGHPSSRVPQDLRPSEGPPEAPTRSDVNRAIESFLYKSQKRAISTLCTQTSASEQFARF